VEKYMYMAIPRGFEVSEQGIMPSKFTRIYTGKSKPEELGNNT
jgi:hypothetical protein